MATYTGQLGKIELGANAIAEIRSFEINAVSDTLDDTVMGDTWRTNKSTFRSWSGSMEVLYDPGNTTGQVALTIGSTAAATFYPSGDTAGMGELAGTVRVTERQVQSAHEDLVMLTIQFIGDGALTEGVVV